MVLYHIMFYRMQIISPAITNLKKIIRICEEYFIKFNSEKTEVMIFGTNRRPDNICLKFNDNNIEKVSRF